MSYNSIVAADSPVAWWRLDEASGATSVADSSGNGHTGTVTAPVTFGVANIPAGMTGTVSSWNSNSTQDILITGYAPSFTAASWELWYNQNGTNAGNNPRVIGDGPAGDPAGFVFFLLGKVTPYFSCGNGTTNSNGAASSSIVAGWNHIVVTYDGSAIRFYLNGVAAGNFAFTGTIGPHVADKVEMGGNFPWEAHDPFSGLLCEVALYNYALSMTQILAHYNAGITRAVIADDGDAPWHIRSRRRRT